MRASECPGFSHNDQIVLAAPVRRHWLDEHPLTRADLEVEAKYLKKAGFRLEVGD